MKGIVTRHSIRVLKWNQFNDFASKRGIWLDAQKCQFRQKQIVLLRHDSTQTNRWYSDHITTQEANHAVANPTGPLPSLTQTRRSRISRYIQTFMEEVLAKAVVAGHRVNRYTGTDYSGIEALRRQIGEQEQQVRDLHNAVNGTKTSYTQAHSLQIVSQKEVVSLLERKSSWTPSDLDRYTSLIRSEHLHEQSVISARHDMSKAEKELDLARTELERKERQQYHEEQIWSDNIRRNSTWVTFGLMGLNILLLVGNIGIVEPWKRRKLVREVRDVMGDTKSRVSPNKPDAAGGELPIIEPVSATNLTGTKQVETQKLPNQGLDSIKAAVDYEAASPMPTKSIALDTGIKNPWSSSFTTLQLRSFSMRLLEICRQWISSPFASQSIALRNFELTSVAVESAAIGALLSWCISAYFRSR